MVGPLCTATYIPPQHGPTMPQSPLRMSPPLLPLHNSATSGPLSSGGKGTTGYAPPSDGLLLHTTHLPHTSPRLHTRLLTP
eukprot:3163922-Prorocentrum_lima.AAC.1